MLLAKDINAVRAKIRPNKTDAGSFTVGLITKNRRRIIMVVKSFPVIDPVATGENIVRLRKLRGLTVRDLQNWFGFEEPQAIYKWQKGKSLPSVDNLYALGALLDVPMEDILLSKAQQLNIVVNGQQAEACCPNAFSGYFECGRSSKICLSIFRFTVRSAA